MLPRYTVRTVRRRPVRVPGTYRTRQLRRKLISPVTSELTRTFYKKVSPTFSSGARADRHGRRVAVHGFAALRAAPGRRLVTQGSAEMARGGPRRRRGAARCPRSFSLHRGAGGAVASPRTPALLLALLARSFWARRTHPSARRQPTEAMAATAAAAWAAVTIAKCR